MKRRHKREAEVFSIAAIDIFASAMGAFVIISIILMKYYQNETISNVQLEDVADLLFASEQSVAEAQEGAASIAQAKAQFRAEIAKLEDEKQQLMQQMDAIVIPEIPQPKPKVSTKKASGSSEKNKVSFRFLGMKTTRMDFTILVEMSKGLASYHSEIVGTVDRILSSLNEEHRFEIIGYQWVGGKTQYIRLQSSPGLISATEENKQQALGFFKNQNGSYKGSNSVLGAVEKTLSSGSGAIFLLSAGLPFPGANRQIESDGIIRILSDTNNNRKEIHTVAIGYYYKYEGAARFLYKLAARNGGGFMAL